MVEMMVEESCSILRRNSFYNKVVMSLHNKHSTGKHTVALIRPLRSVCASMQVLSSLYSRASFSLAKACKSSDALTGSGKVPASTTLRNKSRGENIQTNLQGAG